jgi:hypothetical protein
MALYGPENFSVRELRKVEYNSIVELDLVDQYANITALREDGTATNTTLEAKSVRIYNSAQTIHF